MSAPLLQLCSVSREYRSGDGKFAALKDINLSIDAGEMIAIVGASGSGKSTLMNILGCLDRPTSGAYRVAGVDVASLTADALSTLRRERFGFVFQRYNLLPDLTALENVGVPAVYAGIARPARHARARELLASLGLQTRLEHRPNQLSGGQQQRVSIARALMNGGEVILADEPTGALDSRAGAELLETLKSLHTRGHTIVLVTHDHNVAMHAERLVELRDGQIICDRRCARSAGDVDNPGIQIRPSPPHDSPRRWRLLADERGRLSEAFQMAILAMKANRLRTFLTMLGIIIGIASVASVVALGQGGQQRILTMIRGMGVNTVDIYPGTGWGDPKAARIETLTPADAEAISRQGNVDSVTPTASATASIRFGSASVSGTINGVGESYFRVHDMRLDEGTLFTASDTNSLAQVVVIDENTRSRLFRASEHAVGQIVFLGPVPFRVVGVARPRLPGDPNLNVWAPFTAVMGRISGQHHLKGITARVSEGSPPDLMEQVIGQLLSQRHGRRDFYMNNTDTIRKSVKAATDTMRNVVLSIAVVSLIVGGIGVMNIMLVSVAERTREIGIRMAVGARRFDILSQFIIEAVLVCVLGGTLGVALSFAASFFLPRLLPQFPMIFSLYSVSMAVGVSMVIGVVFGFVPARHAAKLDPIEALARE